MSGDQNLVVKEFDANGDLTRVVDTTKVLTPKGIVGLLRLDTVAAVEVHWLDDTSTEFSFPEGEKW